jgi:hypothetical protein
MYEASCAHGTVLDARNMAVRDSDQNTGKVKLIQK